MRNRWWLLPIYLGVPAGLLTGGYLCWQTPQCLLYLHSHFYLLVTSMVARQVDYAALIFVGLLAVLWLVITWAGRFTGAARTTLQLILSLAVLALAGKLFLPVQTWPALDRLFRDDEFRFWVRTIVLGIGVLLAYYALCQLWARRTSSSGARASSRAHGSVDGAREDANAPTRVKRITALALQSIAWLSLLLFLSINGAAGVYWALSTVTMRRQPNIILVMVCSLRADHLGCYGYDLPTTPHLDQFARESTRFAQAVAPSSWTLWSTASILTSRYPERIFDSTDIMAKYSLYPGLPPALSNQGYATSVVSSHPFFREQSANSYDFKQGFDYTDLIGPDEFKQKVSPAVTSIALQRARQLTGRKFFLYLMYADPHSPYTQHKEYVFGPSRKDALGPRWAASLAAPYNTMSWERLECLLTNKHAVQQFGGESRERLLARYNSEIAFTDHAIGDLFAGLKSLGLYDDSLIIFCADHGEEFLEHGRYGHQLTLYHEVTDVPLLIKFPHQRQGTVVGGRFPLIDLFPSIMSVIHGDSTHLGVQGESVDLPALLRCADKPIFGATVREVRSVLSGPFKYYRAFKYERKSSAPVEDGLAFLPSQPTNQLFDLRKDPGEYQSIFPRTPGVASSLLGLLHQHDTDLKKIDTLSGPAKPTSPADEEQIRQRLHGLGYLQE